MLPPPLSVLLQLCSALQLDASREKTVCSMFVAVSLRVAEVVGIEVIRALDNLGKDVESLPVCVPYSLTHN